MPALSTFVAAIMVASTTLAIATTLRLGEAQRQLRHDRRVVHQQARQIRSLTKVAYAQQGVLSTQGRLISRLVDNQESMFKNQQGMFRLISRQSAVLH